MSHFYGTLKGSRGEASRCGTKKSGVTTYTASWDGAVRASAWFDAESGLDMVDVSLVTWQGRGSSKLLYRGPISGKLDKEAEADARLREAAPELLEALKKALATHGIRCDMAEKLGLTPPTQERWVPKAHAAIAKVTQ